MADVLNGGFPSEWFIGVADKDLEDLLCGICNDVCRVPVGGDCGHVFCQSCLRSWFASPSESCPTCRESITAQSVTAVNAFIRRRILSLPIYCPNRSAGCALTLSCIGLDERHLNAHRTQCPFESTSCSKCKQVVIRQEMIVHTARDCPHRLTQCDVCREHIEARDMSAHTNNAVRCVQSMYCPNACVDDKDVVTVIRSNYLSDHIAYCPLQTIFCSICGKVVTRSQLDQHINSSQSAHIQTLQKQLHQQSETVIALKSQLDQTCNRHHLETLISQIAHPSAEPIVKTNGPVNAPSVFGNTTAESRHDPRLKWVIKSLLRTSVADQKSVWIDIYEDQGMARLFQIFRNNLRANIALSDLALELLLTLCIDSELRHQLIYCMEWMQQILSQMVMTSLRTEPCSIKNGTEPHIVHIIRLLKLISEDWVLRDKFKSVLLPEIMQMLPKPKFRRYLLDLAAAQYVWPQDPTNEKELIRSGGDVSTNVLLLYTLKTRAHPALHKLTITGHQAIGEDLVNMLSDAIKAGHLRGLTVLNLHQNGISDSGMHMLATALRTDQLPNLIELDLSHNSNNVSAFPLTQFQVHPFMYSSAAAIPEVKQLTNGLRSVAQALTFRRDTYSHRLLMLDLQGNQVDSDIQLMFNAVVAVNGIRY